MSLFENKRFTVITIVTLALVNVALILRFIGPEIIHRFGDKPEDKRENFVANRLGFDAEQKQKFDSLNVLHKTEVMALQSQINEKRKKIFDLTRTGNADSSTIGTLTKEIGVLVGEMEYRTFEHISGIREIATPEQIEKMETVFKRMMRFRGGRSPQSGPPNERRK